jgi:signal transduction histidine kinase
LDKLVEQRTSELREALQELEQFSYALTHDLRSPLRAIQGYASLIAEEDGAHLRPVSLDYLRRIGAACERLDCLVRDALQYNQIVRQQFPLKPIELSRFLRDLIETYPDLLLHKAHIQFDGPWPRVLANEAALAQCFANLLRNAVNFVAPSAIPQVRVWSEPRETMLRFWVQDNGVGIPPEVQHHLFGMFQRHNTQSPGTGTGLAITRKAVERMGGRVGVESEPGQGSRFWVELRIADSAIRARPQPAG